MKRCSPVLECNTVSGVMEIPSNFNFLCKGLAFVRKYSGFHGKPLTPVKLILHYHHQLAHQQLSNPKHQILGLYNSSLTHSTAWKVWLSAGLANISAWECSGHRQEAGSGWRLKSAEIIDLFYLQCIQICQPDLK